MPPGVVGSWGPDVAAYARTILGIELDRWQRRALNRELAYGADGRLVHRIYLTSTGRQNGKTVKVRSLAGWALTAHESPDWRSILGLAHDRAQARIPYLAVLADLAPLARRLGPPARGGLALTRYLGIRSGLYGRHREYHTGSREARDAIRGLSTDLGLFDEVRTQRDFDTWAALAPTTLARPDPLVDATSTAGDDRSVLLRAWFDRGIRIIDGAEPAAGFGMTWYAADDRLGAGSLRAWRQANPAVAEGRIPLSVIAQAYRSLPPAQFRAEHLNLWSEALDEWLPPGTWSRQAAPQPADWSRCILGVEVTPTWQRASITVALVTDAGVWTGLAAELDVSRMAAATVSPADLRALLEATAPAWSPIAVAYSKAAAAAPHVEAWTAEQRILDVALGPRQIRAASELFRSELIGGRLAHAADPLLELQARQARPSGALEAGAWYLSIRDSLGDVDAVRAAAWAAWAAIAPEVREAAPQLFV
jgi:hypothetical protein